MDLSRLLRQTITVEHVTADGPPDGMGDPTEEVTTSSFLGWLWQTTVPTDSTANTSVSTEQWEVALDRSAAGQLDAGDTIVADGLRFDVDGPPWSARNPRTQVVEYVHARLVRSER